MHKKFLQTFALLLCLTLMVSAPSAHRGLNAMESDFGEREYYSAHAQIAHRSSFTLSQLNEHLNALKSCANKGNYYAAHDLAFAYEYGIANLGPTWVWLLKKDITIAASYEKLYQSLKEACPRKLNHPYYEAADKEKNQVPSASPPEDEKIMEET